MIGFVAQYHTVENNGKIQLFIVFGGESLANGLIMVNGHE